MKADEIKNVSINCLATPAHDEQAKEHTRKWHSLRKSELDQVVAVFLNPALLACAARWTSTMSLSKSTARILGYPQPNFRALYAHKGDNVTENQVWAYAG